MAPLVTLLTDFGNVDPYVAEVKAVLLSGLADARIVDLTHEVPAFDIRQGAFQLMRSYRFFPKGTCHLAIVDPGVGTSRKILYGRSAHFHFIGPDNGLMRWAIEDCESREGSPVDLYEVPQPSGIDPTFHGRDIFAPFVVRLLKGGKPPHLRRLGRMEGEGFPHAREAKGGVQAEIVAVDRFGNLITSAPHVGDGERELKWKGRSVIASSPNYESIPARGPALIRGSHGHWEISCRNASAQKVLKARLGTPVLLARPGSTKRKR